MTLVKKMTLLFVFMLAGVLASPAQDILARFTLRQPASFNGKVMRAGTYDLQMVTGATAVAMITPVDGVGDSLLVIPTSREYSATCDKNALQMVSENGQWVAKSFCLASAGLTIYFADSPRPTVTTAAFPGSN